MDGRAAVKGGGGDPSGTEGAVYVEFLIAFMPFFIFFLCLWQVSILYTTKIMVDHAANCAARAAAVVMGDVPVRYSNGLGGPGEPYNTISTQRKRRVQEAAEVAVVGLIMDNTITGLQVFFPGHPDGSTVQPTSNGSVITEHMVVQVQVTMSCRIAFANAILCRATGGQPPFTLTLTSQGDYPYMGASFIDGP
jgi:hypothetical protein